VDTHVSAEVFQFGDFRLDRRGGGLFRLNEQGSLFPVEIGSRALELLSVLAEHAGDVVSKHRLLDAVWPGMVVEESNLTVQVAALRRVLDASRSGGSYIQTVPGRGYRLICPVVRVSEPVCPPVLVSQADTAVTALSPTPPPAGRQRSRWSVGILAAAALFVCAAVWAGLWFSQRASPRLSLVVLPFESLSGAPDRDHLAEAITDDLTSGLAQHTLARVTAGETAYTFKGKPEDVRKIGKLLNVRYVVEGSVRQMGNTVRVNVRLISAESGVDLWSDQFDEQVAEPLAAQDSIVDSRMRPALAMRLYEIESARGLRERPNNADAFDLILRAEALQQLPSTLQRAEEVKALYERALQLDPSSVAAMVGLADFLINTRSHEGWGIFDDMRRSEQLLARARAIEPESPAVLNTTIYWLWSVHGRCPEIIDAAQRLIETNPKAIGVWTRIYTQFGVCETQAGHADQEVALQQKQLQRNPFSPSRYSWYGHMGFASLMLGRDQDAIMYFQRSFAANPNLHDNTEAAYRELAAAYARTGQMQQAKHYLAEADRVWPYDTVRSHYPYGSSNPVFVQQIKGFQAALRLAGERDHADEDADFGVPPDRALHGRLAGYTPTTAPGVRTIRTPDLAQLLAKVRPLVIDTVSNSWGQSIPGAVGLKFAGLGGSFEDTAQGRLKAKLHALTAGDLNRPIVAVGWNSEWFDGRNLALRLAALGYRQVYWYRGGREAWEVHGLPEAELSLQDW
jgi:adenylate cyclase